MNKERKLFGKPIRKETTEAMYPEKFTLTEFCEEIHDSIDGFKQNMEHLKGHAEEPKYIEEWFEQFMAWMDVEQDINYKQEMDLQSLIDLIPKSRPMTNEERKASNEFFLSLFDK